MLYWLFQQLAEVGSVFNVFGYITLRTILGALTALLISLVMGPWFIRRLVAQQQIQPIRKVGPETHFSKAGTPTMGGALILTAIAVSTVLWADLENMFVWIVLFVTLSFGVIGYVDDYKKLVLQDPKGISAKQKLFWQSATAIVAAAERASVSVPRSRPSISANSAAVSARASACRPPSTAQTPRASASQISDRSAGAP